MANIIASVIPFRTTRRNVRNWLRGMRMMPGIIDVLSEYQLLVSYSQIAEDIILYKYLHHVDNGFYIDVGAAHPVALSVTKLFYDIGWSGINIEPRGDVMELYNKDRSRDINLALAASNHPGTATIYLSSDASTLNPDEARQWGNGGGTATVRLETLRTILMEYPSPTIHFLKIDVENYEKEVLEGMDFSAFRPWIVVMESTLPGTEIIPTHSSWEYILLKNGYSFLAQHLINRYYVANEKRQELIAGAKDMRKIRYLKYADMSELANSFTHHDKAIRV